MRLIFVLFVHLLMILAWLARPGGVRAVAAESLAVKHQLLIMKRSLCRSRNLTPWDRLILGVCTLLVSQRGVDRMAVIVKSSTLRRLHRALVERKYRLLYTPQSGVVLDHQVPQNTSSTRCSDETAQPVLAVAASSPSSSLAPSGLSSTRMSSGAFCCGIIDPYRGAAVAPGSRTLDTRKIGCGVSICFALSQFCSRATGSWW